MRALTAVDQVLQEQAAGEDAETEEDSLLDRGAADQTIGKHGRALGRATKANQTSRGPREGRKEAGLIPRSASTSRVVDELDTTGD